MTESPNERRSHLRAILKPEIDAKLARANEIASARRIAPTAAERRGFQWVTLDENIRRAVATALGDGTRAARVNPVVFACQSAYTFAIGEAYLDVLDIDKAPIPDHPALTMLRAMPNGMSETDVMRRIAQFMTNGGARLRKVRAKGDGRVLGLNVYTADQVRPKRARGRSVTPIIGWEHIDGGKVVEEWDVTEVIPVDWPLAHPEIPGLCLSPRDAIAAEVAQDEEMTAYLTSLLENDAVPQTIITIPRPTDTMVVDPDARDNMKEMFVEAYGRANRGMPAVLGPGMTVERLSLDLQELAFDALRRVPESRICAAYRVPAQLAGITAGLDSGTYANYAEARRAFTQSTLVPVWRHISDVLTRGLQGEFGETDRWEYWHVLTDVAALQEDASATATRQVERSRRIQELQAAYTAGTLTRDMAIANAVIELQESDENAAALFPAIEPKPETTTDGTASDTATDTTPADTTTTTDTEATDDAPDGDDGATDTDPSEGDA